MKYTGLNIKKQGKPVTAEREAGSMKKGMTELVFILDRSGSMSGLEDDTIGGYNSMLKEQKANTEAGEVVISTILFDSQVEVLHDRKPIAEVASLTGKDYRPGGCTALLDAVGGAIHHIGKLHKELPEGERPEKTLFIITTDGMENSSRNYSYGKVKKMVEKKKNKYQWEFIFLGANIDAVKVSGQFGIAPDRAVRYECDSAGTRLNFRVMNQMVGCVRKCSSAAGMKTLLDEGDMLAEIQEDYERRGNRS